MISFGVREILLYGNCINFVEGGFIYIFKEREPHQHELLEFDNFLVKSQDLTL